MLTMLPNDTKKPGLYQLFSTNYGQIGIPDMGGLKWGKSGKNHLGYLERSISQGYTKMCVCFIYRLLWRVLWNIWLNFSYMYKISICICQKIGSRFCKVIIDGALIRDIGQHYRWLGPIGASNIVGLIWIPPPLTLGSGIKGGDTKGRLPPKVIFLRRSSSNKGHLPQ